MERQLTRDTTRSSGAGLANQTKRYGDLARKARENCQTGQAAEQELQKRRNRSGE